MKIVILCVFSCVIMVLAGVKTDCVNMSVSCSEGWFQFKGRCFLYIKKNMTWTKAEKNCQSMGANLASVQTAEEYYEIQKLTAPDGYKNTWIGGTDAQEDGVWFWSDGEKFSFTSWCSGEPNNDEIPQQCLQINHSDKKCWDDEECDSSLPSVCVKRGWRLVG